MTTTIQVNLTCNSPMDIIDKIREEIKKYGHKNIKIMEMLENYKQCNRIYEYFISEDMNSIYVYLSSSPLSRYEFHDNSITILPLA